MPFLDHDAFHRGNILALFAGVHSRAVDREDAHSRRKDAAFDFDGTEDEVHRRTAAEHRNPFRALYAAYGAVNLGACRQNNLVTDEDRLGDHSRKGIAVMSYRRAKTVGKRNANLRAGNDALRRLCMNRESRKKRQQRRGAKSCEALH